MKEQKTIGRICTGILLVLVVVKYPMAASWHLLERERNIDQWIHFIPEKLEPDSKKDTSGFWYRWV